MKNLMFLGLILAACSTTPSVPTDPKAPDQWVNIMDSTNKVVASVNVKSGQVEYLGSPKVAFESLFSGFAQYTKTCPCCQKAAEQPKKEVKGKKDGKK